LTQHIANEAFLNSPVRQIYVNDTNTNDKILIQIVLIETILRRKKNWIGYVLRGEGMMKEIMEGKCDGRKEEDEAV